MSYRLHTTDGRIRNAGTEGLSWFTTIQQAFKYWQEGDAIYEYDKEGRRLWEVMTEPKYWDGIERPLA